MAEKEMTLTEHLGELRKVIIVSVVSVFIASVISFLLFKERLLDFFLLPVEHLDLSFVYISMTEAFLTKVKISILAGFVVSLPIILWQLWSFIVPALHSHEKKYVYILFPLSLILFAIGVVFAYTTVFNIAAKFLLVEAGEGLTPMISISKYISFLIYFLIPFGVVFQLPLVVAFMSRTGIITAKTLINKRKYAIVLIFVVAAIFTPPDIISQILLAGPVIFLYEISILVARIIKPKRRKLEEVEFAGESE